MAKEIHPAPCHPEVRHWAKGLCRKCWNKQYNKKGPVKTFALGGVDLPRGFYTYLWLREDGTPYYVGKGKGIRGFSVRTHRIHPPAELSRIITQEYESEADALFAEKFLIAAYGREDLSTGTLLNLTDGGDQPPSAKGLKRSKETIAKFVASRRAGAGWKLKPKKIKVKVERKPMSEEHKLKISKTLKSKGLRPPDWAIEKAHFVRWGYVREK